MNPIFKNKTELEIIEEFAQAMGGISSEEELSEMFEEDVKTTGFSHDDKPALQQEFNDWKNQMEQEGHIHPVQAYNYCYVGGLFDA